MTLSLSIKIGKIFPPPLATQNFQKKWGVGELTTISIVF
jgi:hypothetical protein